MAEGSRLHALCSGADDPLRLSHFWAGVLRREPADDPHDGITLLPSDGTGFRIRILPTREQKAGRNLMHFDLTSTPFEDQQEPVVRSLGLGARHIDIGRRPEEGHGVLAGPEGKEFCVIEPGNSFLRSSPGAARHCCRGQARAGCISISPPLSMAINERRSTVSSPSGRLASASAGRPGDDGRSRRP